MLIRKMVTALSMFFFFNATAFSQKIATGNFNDWDFGPSSVFGNLQLSKTAERHYIRISKISDNIAKVETINPSNIVTNTAVLNFKNGLISKVEETNQYGERYDIQTFSAIDSNTFIVTDLLRGVNKFLPCKSAKYIYNNGMLAEVQYLSFTGKLAENSNGVAIVRYERYDDQIRFADTKQISYYDAQRKPVIAKDKHIHKVVYTWDENDNKRSEYYYGNNDEPRINPESNAASIFYNYDENNNLIKLEFHALDGSLTNNIAGVAVGEVAIEKGYPVSVTRYNSQHQPARSAAAGDSIAIIKSEFDEHGNNVENAVFDENGNPINDHQGTHKYVNTYSRDNMLLKVAYFDDFERPSVNRDGFHEIIYNRDEYGRISSQAGIGLNGEPVLNYSDRVYLVKYKYDEYGRRISISYWKDSVTRMPRWSGTYEELTRYNSDGQVIAYEFLDANGKAFRSNDNSSGNTLSYDSAGLVSDRKYFFEGKPVMRLRGVTNGYSIIHYTHDSYGRVSELDFFDTKGQPVNATISINEDFVANRILFIYKGNRIVEQLFYEIGNPTPVKDIDCLKNDFIGTSGIFTGRKNAY